MPELPEVETTIRGLKRTILNLTIKSVWTDLNTKDKRKHDTVANPKYFLFFKKEVVGRKILSVQRIAKNILINLSGGKTILLHLKMTGHLLYGDYASNKKENNRFVHFVFLLSNGKRLAFSDMRKFGKITLIETEQIKHRGNTAEENRHLKNIGPDPLAKAFNLSVLKKQLQKRPTGKIKSVLMDQSIIAGIGNIYSDEILWATGIHPERQIASLSDKEIKSILRFSKIILKMGIDFGGDSMSDYLNIYGKKGRFQLHHRAYRKTGEKCLKRNCKGKIIRKTINGRSAHFCDSHQS